MPDYLLRKGAADYIRGKGLPCTPGTLQKYATVGGGPEYRIFGNKAVYTPPKLDEWITEKLSPPRKSTAGGA
jgi:hypothetical protein